MALNVKTIEMVARIQSQRKTRMLRSYLSPADFLFPKDIPTIDDWLRDSYVYVKKRQKELDEEDRNYKLN